MVAVTSSGTAPILTRKIRSQIEDLLPSHLGKLASFCGSWRSFIKKSIASFELRRRFWEKVIEGDIAEYVYRDEMEIAEEKLKQTITGLNKKGEVYIIGAGSGGPDLLTLEAVRLLQKAEVIIYDRLVSPKIMEQTRRDVEKFYVGKYPGNHCFPQEEINKLIVKFAELGKRVVRLKGGDSLTFAQCGDEIDALIIAGIPFHITPGVTAASACAAYAKIPLTHRELASQCIFISGHQKPDQFLWDTLIQSRQTLVFYMSVSNLLTIAGELIVRGLPKNTPAAIIEKQGLPEQRALITILEDLSDVVKENNVEPPAIVIIGEVVRFSRIPKIVLSHSKADLPPSKITLPRSEITLLH